MKNLGRIMLCLLAMLVLLVPALKADMGVKGGINFANMSASGGGVTLSLTSIQVPVFGVFYSVKLGPLFAIQPELFYCQKGAKLAEGDFSAKEKITYLEIPVLVKYCINTQGKAQPVLFAGPAIGFKLSAKDYYDGEVDDVSDDIKGTEFGVVFGGGVEIGLGSAKLLLDIRYNMGLTNILVEGDELDVSVKNKGIAVMVGVGF